MGYRHYFYKVNKADIDIIKDMNYDELYEYEKKKGCKDRFLNKQEVF